jgi:hypothetical protein
VRMVEESDFGHLAGNVTEESMKAGQSCNG